jgi:putative membrane protein
MVLDAILSYTHFVAVFLLFGLLTAEAFLLRLAPSRDLLRLLARVDMFYGLSAMLVIAAGIARVLWGAKGWDFYAGELFFWLKIAAFAAVGLLSIPPTIAYRRWAKDGAAEPDAASWRKARFWVMLQVHVAALIPLFAALMARGIRP